MYHIIMIIAISHDIQNTLSKVFLKWYSLIVLNFLIVSLVEVIIYIMQYMSDINNSFIYFIINLPLSCLIYTLKQKRLCFTKHKVRPTGIEFQYLYVFLISSLVR